MKENEESWCCNDQNSKLKELGEDRLSQYTPNDNDILDFGDIQLTACKYCGIFKGDSTLYSTTGFQESEYVCRSCEVKALRRNNVSHTETHARSS